MWPNVATAKPVEIVLKGLLNKVFRIERLHTPVAHRSPSCLVLSLCLAGVFAQNPTDVRGPAVSVSGTRQGTLGLAAAATLSTRTASSSDTLSKPRRHAPKDNYSLAYLL